MGHRLGGDGGRGGDDRPGLKHARALRVVGRRAPRRCRWVGVLGASTHPRAGAATAGPGARPCSVMFNSRRGRRGRREPEARAGAGGWSVRPTRSWLRQGGSPPVEWRVSADDGGMLGPGVFCPGRPRSARYLSAWGRSGGGGGRSGRTRGDPRTAIHGFEHRRAKPTRWPVFARRAAFRLAAREPSRNPWRTGRGRGPGGARGAMCRSEHLKACRAVPWIRTRDGWHMLRTGARVLLTRGWRTLRRGRRGRTWTTRRGRRPPRAGVSSHRSSSHVGDGAAKGVAASLVI